MAFHKILPFFVLMLNLLLLGSAVSANGRSERNRSFAYLSLALSIWSLGVIGLRLSEDPSTALTWERFLHLGVVAIPLLFYDYVWVLLGERRRRASVIAGYVIGAAFLVLVPSPLFMRGVRPTVWGFAPRPGPLYAPFLLYFAAYMVLGLVVLLRANRTVGSTFRRNRIRLVLFGVLVSLVGGMVDFLRFTLGLEWLYPAGIPANAIFALALGVAIVRYRLMDVGVIAKRVLLYALTWATTAPALLFTVDALDDLLPGTAAAAQGERPPMNVILLLTVLMLALPFMRHLEGFLNRVMFHRQRAISEALVALNRELSSILDVQKLAATLTAGLVKRVPVAHASLFVPSGQGDVVVPLARATADEAGDVAERRLSPETALWVRATRKTLVVDEIGCEAAAEGPGATVMETLERGHVALVVPVFVDAELTAILVVGEKLSGEVFDPAEIELLEILAARAGTALKNARLYQDLEIQMAELRATRDLYGQAREADRAKEQFLAMLAHELRNPLGPILNAAHVLETIAGEDRRAGAMIAMIERQGQQLTRLLDDLLDVSRIRLGKIRLSAEPVDLRRLVIQGVETLRASGKGHGREIRTRTSDDSLVVLGDPVRLEQVFWNLLDNALKYSPAETPVTVTLGRQGDSAMLRVEDQGMGIPPSMLPAIFDLFTQVDSSLPRSQGGLGLGLALVRSLVEQHGGTVTAHSAGPGHGSTFIVRLPLAPGRAEGRHPSPIAAASRSRRRILLVEDAEDARESLRMVIELLGHEVRCAEDGSSALDVAAGWRPDVALVDIGLPDMDGYEVARRLRATGLGQRMYLAAVTAYGQPDDRRRALESGFDAHFVKPVSSEDIRRMLTDQPGVEIDQGRKTR